MPSYANLAALLAILLQLVPVLAAPAPGGARGGGDEWSHDGFWEGPGHRGDTSVNLGNENTGHGVGGAGQGQGGFDNTHCGNHISDIGNIAATITATVTVTINSDQNGSATVTQTISTCTSTVTTGNNNGGGSTITKTDTLISTISRCTATTTALTTVTTNGPTVTSTVTTNGPVSTTTETIGATTVTDPGVTETQTVTQTITSTDTTTFTDNQIVTEFSTVTTTNTVTLEVTTTVTSNDCSNTGNPHPGNLDYGTCSDPTIRWEYGLDGRTEWAYTTNNQADFPFGSSPNIDAPADLICNRLRSPCNAPQATLDQCYAAENAVRNLTGQEAADVWNSMMT
ncbi:hypothetical protein N7491_001438 [Penicillium cf. griseofulvum]|uniref:Uncharacterized protein n=1 Tax=Penicillium cf. griseofulvum TaxID=2972120 RepID=A0A9W9JD99_9EURO|nr:hypothetical protein N7472_006568 [Penicillium cf. griseofulvum]KAJ5445356.1 hypothetical protein N7491_001438 [Penicillium cf. griseofulvum]